MPDCTDVQRRVQSLEARGRRGACLLKSNGPCKLCTGKTSWRMFEMAAARDDRKFPLCTDDIVYFEMYTSVPIVAQ